MLINYKATRKLIQSHQPVEILTGGDFSSSAGWTLDTWVIDTIGRTANHGAGSSGTLTRDIAAVPLLAYTVSYQLIGVTAGSVQQVIGGNSFGVPRTADGVYAEEIVSGSILTNRYGALADAAFSGKITNISVMLAENYYDIFLDASVFSDLLATKKETVESDDNTSQTIIINSESQTFDITTDIVQAGGSRHLQLIEFFASVREGEEFTIDEDGVIGVQVNPLTVKIVGRERKTKESNSFVKYSFKVKVS